MAQSKQHKSISASDVLKALELIEFGDLNDMLQNELQSASFFMSHLSQLTCMEWTVYRNNTKNDKSKKERAEKSASTAKGKAKEAVADSVSASNSLSNSAPNANHKGKGKEKASTSASITGAMLPPPFTSIPRPISIPVSTSAEQPPANAAAFWRAEEDVEDEEMDAEDEFGGADEDEDVEIDEDEDDEVEAGDEVQDMMAVEEEELRKDATALEEPGLAD